TFELDFVESKPLIASSDQRYTQTQFDRARLSGLAFCRPGTQDLQLAFFEESESLGPAAVGAHLVPDRLSGPRPIDPRVVAPDTPTVRGLRIILRRWSRLIFECSNQQSRPDRRQTRLEREVIVFCSDGDKLLEQDRPGV